MPRNTQLDPYEALLRRSEHDPGLRARIAAARDRGIPASMTARNVASETGDEDFLRPDLPLTAPEDDINSPSYRRFREDAPDATDAPAPKPICPIPLTTPRAADEPSEAPDDGEAGEARAWGLVPSKLDKRGRAHRRRKVAPWYADVSKLMADGTSLRAALAKAGVELTPREIFNLRHQRAFIEMYQRERREFLARWGRQHVKKGVPIERFHQHRGKPSYRRKQS